LYTFLVSKPELFISNVYDYGNGELIF